MQPTIIQIPLKELTVSLPLSGRTQKEIDDNAGTLATIMHAAGGWAQSMPGEVFKRDGAWHLLSGFTRRAASLANGEENGWFVEVPDDELSNTLACIRTNSGKSISALAQGTVFAKLRDEQKMDAKAISALVGRSHVWVSECLGIYESTPEIGKLIEEGKISSGLAIKAKQLFPDETKRLKVINAAVKEAKGERATERHLDAVKSDFIKLKAVSNDKSETPKDAPQSPVSEPEPSSNVTTPPDYIPPQEPLPSNDLALENPVITTPKPKNQFALFRKVIEDWSNSHGIECNDGQIAELARNLVSADLPM